MQEYIARRLCRIEGGQRAKGQGQYIPALTTNSVNKSFIALLINPNNFIEKIDLIQQSLLAESSCELTSILLVHGDLILSFMSHKIEIFY